MQAGLCSDFFDSSIVLQPYMFRQITMCKFAPCNMQDNTNAPTATR